MNTPAKLISVIAFSLAALTAVVFTHNRRHGNRQKLFKTYLDQKASYITKDSQLVSNPTKSNVDLSFTAENIATPYQISKNAVTEEFISATQTANQKIYNTLDDKKLTHPLNINIFNLNSETKPIVTTQPGTQPETDNTATTPKKTETQKQPPAPEPEQKSAKKPAPIQKTLPNPKIRPAPAKISTPIQPKVTQTLPATTPPQKIATPEPASAEKTIPAQNTAEKNISQIPSTTLQTEKKPDAKPETKTQTTPQTRSELNEPGQSAKTIPATVPATQPLPPSGFTLNSIADSSTDVSLGWEIKTLILNFMYLMAAIILALGFSRTIMREKTDQQGMLLFALPKYPAGILLAKFFHTLIPITILAGFISYWQNSQPISTQATGTLFVFIFSAAALIAVSAPNLRANSMLMLGLTTAAAYSQLLPPVLFSTSGTAQISLLGIMGTTTPVPAAYALVIPTYLLCSLCLISLAAMAFNAEDFFSPSPALSTLFASIGRKTSLLSIVAFPFFALPFIALVELNINVPLSGLITNFKPFQSVHTQMVGTTVGIFLKEIIRLSPLLALWLSNSKTSALKLISIGAVSGLLFAPVHRFCQLYTSRYFPEILLGANIPELWIYTLKSMLLGITAAVFIKIVKPRGIIYPVLLNTIILAAFYYAQLSSNFGF